MEEGVTLEQVLEKHPDLAEIRAACRAADDRISKLSEQMAAAHGSRIQIPGLDVDLRNAQIASAIQLDRVAREMNDPRTRNDEERSAAIAAIYQEASQVWTQLLISAHMTRGSIREPSRYHEFLLREATAWLERATGGKFFDQDSR